MKTIEVVVVSICLVVLVFFAITTWTSAQSSNLIQACVAKDGTIRIVAAGSNCRDKEMPLQWNKAGPPGSPGLLRTYTATSTIEVDATSAGYGTTARCDVGDKVTGGGYNVEALSGGSIAFANFGALQNSPEQADNAHHLGEGWTVRVWSNFNGANFALKVYAVCAHLTQP